MKARFRVGRTAGRKPTLASLATPMFWLSPNNVQIILRIFAQLTRSSRINAKAFSRDLIGNRSWEFGKIPDRTRKAPFRDDDVLDSRGLFSALESNSRYFFFSVFCCAAVSSSLGASLTST